MTHYNEFLLKPSEAMSQGYDFKFWYQHKKSKDVFLPTFKMLNQGNGLRRFGLDLEFFDPKTFEIYSLLDIMVLTYENTPKDTFGPIWFPRIKFFSEENGENTEVYLTILSWVSSDAKDIHMQAKLNHLRAGAGWVKFFWHRQLTLHDPEGVLWGVLFVLAIILKQCLQKRINLKNLAIDQTKHPDGHFFELLVNTY